MGKASNRLTWAFLRQKPSRLEPTIYVYTCVYIYIYMCVYIYIYIYIYNTHTHTPGVDALQEVVLAEREAQEVLRRAQAHGDDTRGEELHALEEEDVVDQLILVRGPGEEEHRQDDREEGHAASVDGHAREKVHRHVDGVLELAEDIPTLYYTILYYTILYYTILYYTILYYTIPSYPIRYCSILSYTLLYRL